MFSIYFPVCLRAVIAHLVLRRDNGMRKIFSNEYIDGNISRQNI